MRIQRLFDYRRVDVVTTADDQFLGTTREPEIALRIATRQIAGMQPQLSIAEVEPDTVVLLCRAVPGKHVRPADDEHARLVIERIALVDPAGIEDHGLHRLAGKA